MAGRIPQYERQVAAQADRRVISTPVLNQDVGEGDALRAIGGAINEGVELAVRLEKANQDRQITTADRVAREKLDRLKFDLENTSPDVPDEDLKKRYQEQSEAAIQEAGRTIANSRARDIFTERAKGYQSEGALWTDRQALKRGVDRTRAGHVTAITEIEAKAGDVTIKRETVLTDIAGEKAAVERARQMGVYTQEQAAELNAKLDGVAVKDYKIRWSAGVVSTARAGDFETAEKMVAEEKTISSAEREDALSAIQRERTKQEKEKAEGQRALANAMEVDILDGRVTRSQIDEAVALGTINPNDQPVLIRSLRAEEARRRAEAEQARMTAAERKAMEERSEDVRFVFEAMADMSPSKFLTGPDGWSETERKYYSLMTPADQRAVDRKLLDMQLGGQTTTAAGSVYSALVDEAKRIVPEWQLSSDAKNLDENSLPFRGALRKAAEQIAKEKGGKPLTVDEARDAVARALRSYQPDKWMGLPTNQRDIYLENPGAASFKTEAGIMATDGGSRFAYDEGANIRNEIRAEWIKAKGKPPTKAELDAEYARVVAD